MLVFSLLLLRDSSLGDLLSKLGIRGEESDLNLDLAHLLVLLVDDAIHLVRQLLLVEHLFEWDPHAADVVVDFRLRDDVHTLIDEVDFEEAVLHVVF